MVKRYVERTGYICSYRWADIDIIDVMKWTKQFPLCFYTLQVIQDWGGGRPLDKATLLLPCDLFSGSLFPSAVRPQQNRFMIIKVWYRTICFHDDS